MFYVICKRKGEAWRIVRLDGQEALGVVARHRVAEPEAQWAMAPEDRMQCERELALALRLWQQGRE